jgi:hypothetical protein
MVCAEDRKCVSSRLAMNRARIPIVMWFSAVLVGCSLPSEKRGLDARDPAARSRAALDAVERGDQRAIPALISMLDSEDPALRMVACESLERLTGERFGYDPTSGERAREASIERWVAWWESRQESRGDGGAE